MERYDVGLLNDYGGGNVEWWFDYIRAEIERCENFHEAQLTEDNATIARLEAELAVMRRALELMARNHSGCHVCEHNETVSCDEGTQCPKITGSDIANHYINDARAERAGKEAATGLTIPPDATPCREVDDDGNVVAYTREDTDA